MNRLPGTGIPLHSPAVARTAVVVCGENPADVYAIIDQQLQGWKHETLSWGCREFYFRSYRRGADAVTVLVGGLGSASVELILQEGSLAGVRNFVLTGSCASLRDEIEVGSLVLPRKLFVRPGAYGEYVANEAELRADGDLQTRLETFLSARGENFHPVSMLSTDAFYGIGGSFDASGAPAYAGAPLRNGARPRSLDLALRNTLGADTLDMECAPFFALGQLIESAQVAAVKAVSNKLPWRAEDFNEARIAQALRAAVNAAVGFATELATDLATEA